MPAGTANLANEPVDLDVVLLAIEPVRTFTKRDGTTGEMAEAVIGDSDGTARLVAWAPELLAGLSAGTTVHITSAKPNNRAEGRNYSIDDKSTVTPADTAVVVPFTPLGSVADNGIYSVKGTVKQVQQPRSFTTRNGTTSWVRNAVIQEADDELKIVLWGDTALIPIAPGDQVEVYHATAKPGRFGGIELGVGRGSAFRVPAEIVRPITFSGTIIAGPGCLFIDNGTERYLIEGTFAHGSEVKITGLLSGSRILPEQVEMVVPDAEAVLQKIQEFRDALKG
jgi:replication factor A1